MNNLTQEQVSDVKSLDELLFDYGNTAYQEGVEGRSHDTIDGKAEKTFQAIKKRFQELEKRLTGSVPKSEIEKLINRYSGVLYSFSDSEIDLEVAIKDLNNIITGESE
jgi:hypothetical protein